ncbi:hypothetical protein ES288_D06G243900v1 [Gossypium darwinii]|uniref:Uncharacterized protein n=1 Tax=Gossypium darwinii TaxID=34276 RepID=A0A5D2CCW1_GOSDA|nr:hypothetical protein ES288_D06G243900v1 [Gossypium darwinii]
MAQPIVITARGSPPHLSATCLAISISPHTSKDLEVKISLEPFSWLGLGIPTWFKSTLSHKSSNNTTNFL